MSTILYRDGNAERIAPAHVESHLTNGYFVTREESLGESPDDTGNNSVDDLGDNSNQDGGNNGSEIDDTPGEDEFRLMAEALGIIGWNTLDIDTLKIQVEEANGSEEDEFTP